jgi:hypothetical protein
VSEERRAIATNQYRKAGMMFSWLNGCRLSSVRKCQLRNSL